MGKTSGGGGGGGKGKGTGGGGGFSAAEQQQIDTQAQKINTLPNVVKQRQIANARENIPKVEKEIEHLKKLNNNDRFRAETDAVTRKNIEDRKQDIAKKEAQIKMIAAVLKKVT